MTGFWAAVIGFIFVGTAQAAQPPLACQGLLSDPEVYKKVGGAVTYTLVFNAGSASPDKIFSDLAHWLEDEASPPLQKIRSEIDGPEMREQISACYPNLDKKLHPEAAKRAEAAKQAEAAKRAEAAKQAEAAKRVEAARKVEEPARQAWEAGAPARAAEAAKQAEIVKQAEQAARQAWEAGVPARAAAAARQAEAVKQAQQATREAWARAATEHKLKAAYANYIVLKRCHNEPESFGSVSEPQLAQAQAAVSALEQSIKTPNIDLDTVWEQAKAVADENFSVRSMREAWPGRPSNPVELLCNRALDELMQPEEPITKKDFEGAR